ncbi:MAG: glyceraldehyde-3-phosphate dehydrogenase [Bdellovibrionales bacterium]|jgi:glyceraldehyde 3-phosphate dehydrogenase|nr:glyceraldehyde-3-phosphate dehydrogenase [Bdellovibrionales bacterium]MBT3526301.1 glyceraldehyde-3-phosphate dehydrogenase [Bdellovibrionales bacterium]MBT7668878.1 glyceraldehyde-3-phosphate dehydrogenase [Bdellovibrionales bacterium]MBT7767847.1 glyceraldehyde-3-phosphate dehydrogenase [Bdellovibrionales bacterium]
MTHNKMKADYDKNLATWIDQEKTAVELINVVSNLWLNRSIKLKIFKKPLFDLGSSSIIKLHEYANNVVGHPITIFDTLTVALELLKLDLGPSKIDIGRLASEWLIEKEEHNGNPKSFVKQQLRDFLINKDTEDLAPKDVVLYGFGRIGRLCARDLLSQVGKGSQLRLKAIVTRSNSDDDITKRANLLRTDSIHGLFPGTVVEDVENKSLILNGNVVRMIATSNPAEVDYTKYGINHAILIDNTGVWRDREGLGQHLNAKGISKVLLTAPGKDDIPNVVVGINDRDSYCHQENIYSAASCTTNAIVPILSVIEKNFSIEKGHIETIHAYTNDQNLLDNFHKKHRRGRSAALNMVLTETGAAKAVAKVIPNLKGKLTANAVRVPTPNGSLAIMSLTLAKKTSVEIVNNAIREAALQGNLVDQIRYSVFPELVSSDIVGTPTATIFDSNSTIVSNDGKNIVLYGWYDNEFGYTRQVIRLSKIIMEVNLKEY